MTETAVEAQNANQAVFKQSKHQFLVVYHFFRLFSEAIALNSTVEQVAGATIQTVSRFLE